MVYDMLISGTNAADLITVDFTALDSVVVDLGHGHVQPLDPPTFHSVSVYLRAGTPTFAHCAVGRSEQTHLSEKGFGLSSTWAGSIPVPTAFRMGSVRRPMSSTDGETDG